VLRINLALGAARIVLVPLVIEYLNRYPKVGVELVTEGALVDVVGQGFDAGVRLAEFLPPDMVAIPINRSMQSIVVGSPGYFKAHGRPQTPAELMKHRCIRARMASGVIYRWEFEKRGESLALDVPGTLILDESDLMLQAALAGHGLAYLSDYAIAEHLASGQLEPILEDWSPAYPGLCLYYPSRRNVPAKLRAFIDLVREQERNLRFPG
jgi:DNA-binding transcriptional LysR family regulator